MKRQRIINYGKSGDSSPPPVKKQALQPESSSSPPTASPSSIPKSPLASASSKRIVSPVSTIKSSSSPSATENPAPSLSEIVYEVLWTTRSSKVHKTYDNGTLMVKENRCTLYDSANTLLATTGAYSTEKLSDLKEDDDLRVGDKELKVQCLTSKIEAVMRAMLVKESQNDGIVKPKVVSKLSSSRSVGPLHLSSNAPLKVAKTAPKLVERVDPNRFVLYSPVGIGKPTTEVVLEPFLRHVLRPHQLEGVRFLFECTTGMRSHQFGPTCGCILADVMGLGKTLQTIALLRTLSTQNPNGSTNPLVRKSLVLAPASLIAPWANEVTKWLGRERMAPLIISELQKPKAVELLKRFADSVDQKLLILSYEQLRIHLELLKSISFGIVICDEGHRLKNPASKLAQDLQSLEIPRRVILSGTPFQNNLSEYYALVDFVNPGALGSAEEFKRTFERPIAAGRARGASSSIHDLGLSRSRELIQATSSFILRRTGKVLEAFLPPKHEVIVFCKPTPQQLSAYCAILSSVGLCSNELLDHEEDAAIEIDDETIEESGLDGSSALSIMTQLSKICNHPSLVLPRDFSSTFSPIQVEISEMLIGDHDGDNKDAEMQRRACEHPSFSGKLLVLERLLDMTKSSTSDKVVIVSSFTKTLDLIQHLARTKKWSCARLDGSTDIAHRNHAVEQFQRDPNMFLFLLSTKAGGVGLNLFAANRLVLFDSCWNPAFDTQAQARVWRDGQTKTTWVYRFLTTGMLDEKIFQRQLVKNEMGKTVLEEAEEDADEAREDASTTSPLSTSSAPTSTTKSTDASMLSISSFSTEDLKDIFSVNTSTNCDTHDISGCQCLASSNKKSRSAMYQSSSSHTKRISKDEISEWDHFSSVSKFDDPIFCKAASEQVSFIFSRSTHPTSASSSLEASTSS